MDVTIIYHADEGGGEMKSIPSWSGSRTLLMSLTPVGPCIYCHLPVHIMCIVPECDGVSFDLRIRSMVVYFSTYANPLYSTSDLRQIRYTTDPTYNIALCFTDSIWTCGRCGRSARPPSLPSCGARPLACPSYSARLT